MVEKVAVSEHQKGSIIIICDYVELDNTMRITAARIRKLHRFLAPIMIFPILLTLITGVIYQIAALNGYGGELHWLIHWHKGEFGYLDLQTVYPFLNGAGLLFLAITGISMWWKAQRPRKKDAQ